MTNKLPFLPDEHHYAITHVIARAALLDHAIHFSAASQLAPRGQLARYLLANVDLNRLIKVLHAVLLDNFAATRHDEINKLMETIRTARSERNDLMHWLWQASDEDPDRITLAQVRPYKPEATKSKTAAELYALANTMLETVTALHKLDDEHFARLTMEESQRRAWFDTLSRLTPPPSLAFGGNPDQPLNGGLFGPLLQPSQEKSEPDDQG